MDYSYMDFPLLSEKCSLFNFLIKFKENERFLEVLKEEFNDAKKEFIKKSE